MHLQQAVSRKGNRRYRKSGPCAAWQRPAPRWHAGAWTGRTSKRLRWRAAMPWRRRKNFRSRHDPQCIRHCGGSGQKGDAKSRPEPGNTDTALGLFTSLFRYKVLETGGEWVDAPTRKLKPSQLCPSGWHVVKKAVVVAIALLRAMWALGEQGYGLSACGVALGLGIDIRWGTGRDGDSTSL